MKLAERAAKSSVIEIPVIEVNGEGRATWIDKVTIEEPRDSHFREESVCDDAYARKRHSVRRVAARQPLLTGPAKPRQARRVPVHL